MHHILDNLKHFSEISFTDSGNSSEDQFGISCLNCSKYSIRNFFKPQSISGISPKVKKKKTFRYYLGMFLKLISIVIQLRNCCSISKFYLFVQNYTKRFLMQPSNLEKPCNFFLLKEELHSQDFSISMIFMKDSSKFLLFCRSFLVSDFYFRNSRLDSSRNFSILGYLSEFTQKKKIQGLKQFLRRF